MNQIVLTSLAAVLGFLGKSIWDIYWKRREEVESLARQKRVEFLERQLSEFYWPLYLRLQKNNVIWDHLIQGRASNVDLKSKVDVFLYASFFLPNHEEMVRVIERGFIWPDQMENSKMYCCASYDM